MTRRAVAVGTVMLAGLLGLGGCAETTLTVDTAKSVAAAVSPDPQREGSYKVGAPYEIGGRRYTPAEDFAYDEVGVASWYGPKFHGRRTANGERFDQNAMTAAHPTLPMPSVVQVTNLENGRRVTVRVNDRGPFADNRIIDVSKKAADLLGFRHQGTARVRIRILAEESLALRDGLTGAGPGAVRIASADPGFVPTGAPAVDGWFIQAGAFSDSRNARRVVSDLASVAPAHLAPVTRDGRDLVRVRIGPLPDGRAAARLLQAVQASGYPEARLIGR
ncbi:septal ring lytic transglycosylase RlpA family protein [Roseospira goensis]|uniref:Endolytic peptidoglycan transglycosylase RlpA n=1 Tax=Roseospira goensis TaxID=391922 RepID=A0A7W6RWY2_9PROT|nr:septal ring lytic transglycosylase RlpA family protein [Roseospira goensis]MBB4284735.1 rare lipoprotein A [Roseospira goensis]